MGRNAASHARPGFPKWDSSKINPDLWQNSSGQKVTVNQPQFTTIPPQTHHQKTTFNHSVFAKPPAKTPKPSAKK
jgi:hypothetical protein